MIKILICCKDEVVPRLGPFLIISDADTLSWCYFDWNTEGGHDYYTTIYQADSSQALWEKQTIEKTLYVYEPVANSYAYYVISHTTVYRVPVMSYGTERVINAIQEARIIDSGVRFEMSRKLKARELGLNLNNHVLLDDAQAKTTIHLRPSIPAPQELKTANQYAEQYKPIITVSVSRARELLQVKVCRLVGNRTELQETLPDGEMVVWEENKQWFYQVGLLGDQLFGEWNDQLDKEVIAILNQQKTAGNISIQLRLSRPYLKLTPWQQEQVIEFISMDWPLSSDFSVKNQIKISRSIIRGSLIADDDEASAVQQSSSEEVELINQVNQFRPNLFPSRVNAAFGKRFYAENDPSDALISDIIRYIQRLLVASIRELGDTQEITTQAISESSQVKCGTLPESYNSNRLIYTGLCAHDSELLQLITQFELGLLDTLTKEQLEQLKRDIKGIMNPAIHHDYMDLANELLAVIQAQQNLSSVEAKNKLDSECLEIIKKILVHETKIQSQRIKNLFKLMITKAIGSVTINSLSNSRDSIAEQLSELLIESDLKDQLNTLNNDGNILDYIIPKINAFNLSSVLKNLAKEAQITLFEFLGLAGLKTIFLASNRSFSALFVISVILNSTEPEAYPALFKFLDHTLIKPAIKDSSGLIRILKTLDQDRLISLVFTLTTKQLIIENTWDLAEIMCSLKPELRINLITWFNTNGHIKQIIKDLHDLSRIALTLPLETREIFFDLLNNEVLLNLLPEVLDIQDPDDKTAYLNKKVEELFFIGLDRVRVLSFHFNTLPPEMHAYFLSFIGEAKIRSIGQSEYYNNIKNTNNRDIFLSYIYEHELTDMLKVLNPSAHVLLINILGTDVLKLIIKDSRVLDSVLRRLCPEAHSVFLQLFTVKEILEFGYPLTDLLSILSQTDRINVINSFREKEVATLLHDYQQLSTFLKMVPPETQRVFITSLGKDYFLSRIKGGGQLAFFLNALTPDVQHIFVESLSDESCRLMIGNEYALCGFGFGSLESSKCLINNLSSKVNILEWMIKNANDLLFVIENISADLRHNFLISLSHDKLMFSSYSFSVILSHFDNEFRIQFMNSLSDKLLNEMLAYPPNCFLGKLDKDSRLPYLKSLSVKSQFKLLVSNAIPTGPLVDVLKTLDPDIRNDFLNSININVLKKTIPSASDLIMILKVLTPEKRISFLTSISPEMLRFLFGGSLFHSITVVIKSLSFDDQDKFLAFLNDTKIESIGLSGYDLADCLRVLPQDVTPRFLGVFEGQLKSIVLPPCEYGNNSAGKLTYTRSDWKVLYQFFVHSAANPNFKAFIRNNPESLEVFSASLGCINNLEKKLQTVKTSYSEQPYHFFGYKSSAYSKLLADLTSAQWLDSLLTGEKTCSESELLLHPNLTESAELAKVFLTPMCQSMIQQLTLLSSDENLPKTL